MNPALTDALARGSGALTRDDALAAVPRWVLDYAVGAGHLVRVLPRVYVDGARVEDASDARGRTVDADVRGRGADGRGRVVGGSVRQAADADVRRGAVDAGVRRGAVVAYCAGRAAVSHTSALEVWGIAPCSDPITHVTTPDNVRIRSTERLVVHRRRGLVLGPPDVVVRAGVPVMRLESALVDAWPLLGAEPRRATVIGAVNDGRTTPGRVREALDRVPKLPGRAELAVLLDRLASGCRSPLEIWGHDHVFTGPGMPRFARQVPVVSGARTYYLDVFAEKERVDFELDGAAWHGSSVDRERDVRRDAALAAQGILVVRFTHRRLVSEPEEIRREILAILAARAGA